MTDAEQIAALQSQVAALTEERDALFAAFTALEGGKTSAARDFVTRSRAAHRDLLLSASRAKQELLTRVATVTEERDDMFRRFEPERLPPPIEEEPREEPSR
jgi:hypothetical protein